MPLIEGGVKLKRGSITRIAERKKLAVRHVSLVASGERPGSVELVKEIKRTARRQAAQKKVA